MFQPTDFSYPLPKSAIAQTPASPRDSAKLLTLNKSTGEIQDKIFSDLAEILTPNDVLVINNSKVFPARIQGIKPSGGHTEVLLLHPLGNDEWEALGRDLKPGHHFVCAPTPGVNAALSPGVNLTITILSKLNSGHLVVKLSDSSLIDKLGETPIPPYINTPLAESDLRREYQTVYAKDQGSAAAPTAGMHFTSELLTKLQSRGVQIEAVTLHVGAGTFAKLLPEQIKTKTLHTEWYEITPAVADRLNTAKAAGKRIIAIGTTSCRTLESASLFERHHSTISSGTHTTNLFIQPGFKFNFVDAMITNFHLPESSLLMLVTAFELDCHPRLSRCYVGTIGDPGNLFSSSHIHKAYLHALANNYRFFSFGDAMFIY